MASSSASRIPTRPTQPQHKRMLTRKHSSSTSNSSATNPLATPSLPTPHLADPDIGLDDSSTDDDDDSESQPYSRPTIPAKPALPAQHHHHPGRLAGDEQKERIPSPSPAMSLSRRSVSVTRDDSPPAAAAAASLASYDPSVLSTVTTLQQQLQQKDAELQQLSEALLLLQSSPSAALSSAPPSTTSALVKDLMRHKRDLHLQLSRERQQHSQQLSELRTSLLADQQPAQCGDCDRLRDELAGLAGRLSGAKAAVREWQRKCERLESVLVRECGGAEELSEAVKERGEEKEGGESGWKGRAERVRELERKVSLLQAKLKDQQASLGSLQGGKPTTTAVDSALERKREDDEKRRRRELDERDRQLSELKEGRRLQGARVRTLEVEVGEMKQRLLVMVDKSEMDDAVIDRLKVERKEREAAKDHSEARWQQKEQGWQDRLQRLEAQVGEWQHKWQQGQHWQAAIDTLTTTTATNQAAEWTIERTTLHSLISQLQQRCDQLTIDKLTAQRTADADAKRAAKARLSLPKAAAAAGAGSGRAGAGGGVVGEEERRRLVDVVGERELIRETYAAMLERREEELEQWKAMRVREKEEEQKTREEMKAQVAALIRSMQQAQAIDK